MVEVQKSDALNREFKLVFEFNQTGGLWSVCMVNYLAINVTTKFFYFSKVAARFFSVIEYIFSKFEIFLLNI